MVPLSLTRKWSLIWALPVFVISNQGSERAHSKDIHTNIHTIKHLLKEPMPNSALMQRGHFLNYSLVTHFPVPVNTHKSQSYK